MFSYFAIGFLLVYGSLATFFCIRFALTVLRVQDSLQSALETIDEKYDSISEILQRPLFFDSQEVRQVLKDIESTRDALETVAQDLSNKIENPKEEEKILNEG